MTDPHSSEVKKAGGPLSPSPGGPQNYTAKDALYNIQEPSAGKKVVRCCSAIPTALAHYLLRPFGIIRQSTLAKLLAVAASVYILLVTGLYMFGSEYIPFPDQAVFKSGSSRLQYGSSGDASSRLHPKIPSRPSDYDEPDVAFDPYSAYDAMVSNPADTQDFSWYDWVDVRDARKMFEAVENGGMFGKWKGKNPFKDMHFPPNKPARDDELALVGRHFLDQHAPKPRKVIFLGKNGRVVNIGTADGNSTTTSKSDEEMKKDAKKAEEENVKTDTMDAKAKEMEQLEKGDEKENKDQEQKQKRGYHSTDSLFPELLKEKLDEKVVVDMPWDLFLFNAKETAAKLEKENKDDPEALAHAKVLKTAVEHVKTSGKHFHEVPVKGTSEGLHYDWRFFNKLRKDKDHESIMHHLIRTWSMFSDQENILSLIAHGSLIGWFWDGMAMPWDADNDVQMPIQELDRFARKFNQTLVVQDPAEGNGRYFVDVGPWYVQRERGNGKNVIDARFIDVRSGIYLDITGLAATGKGFSQKKANCKNWHTYHIDQLSPARRTLYEGVQVYVPNAFDSVLEQEYKNYQKNEFKDYIFSRALRMWVKKDDCKNYRDSKKQFNKNKELTFYGACENEKIWNEYNLTEKVTEEHGKEFDLYSDLFELADPSDDEDNNGIDPKKQQELNKKFAEVMDGFYPPLRYDPL